MADLAAPRTRFAAEEAASVDLTAEVIDALEAAEARIFRVFPLAVLRLAETDWRAVVGLRIDGRAWGLSPTQALHIALCIRAGGFDGPGAAALADLFEVATRQADSLAALRNRAADFGGLTLSQGPQA